MGKYKAEVQEYLGVFCLIFRQWWSLKYDKFSESTNLELSAVHLFQLQIGMFNSNAAFSVVSTVKHGYLQSTFRSTSIILLTSGTFFILDLGEEI